MSSKARKRASPSEPVKNSTSSVKNKRKKTDKENQRSESTERKNSGDDSGFPSCSSSFSEPKSSPIKTKKQSTPKKRTKVKKEKEEKVEDVNMMDIAQLLELGEGDDKPEKSMSVDSFGTSESEADEWEEVEEQEEKKEPIIPKEGVNITLDIPDIHAHRRKKKGPDIEGHIRRQINRVKKEMQLMMHKVHVLCWIAHLKYVNQMLNSQLLMGVSLSLVTSKNLYPPKYADLDYLERIVKWFGKTIDLKDNTCDLKRNLDLSEQLFSQFENKTAYSKKHLVLMFVSMMRTLGLKTRLIMSFQVVKVKPTLIELGYIEPKVNGDVKKPATKKKIQGESSYFKPEEESKPGKKPPSKKSSKKTPEPDSESDDEAHMSKHFKGSLIKSSKADEERSKDASDSSKYFSGSEKKSDQKNVPKNKKNSKTLKTPKNVKPVARIKSGESSDTDSEFTPASIEKSKKKIDRRVLSSDEEETPVVKKRQGVDVWSEVFLESEEKWISVDVPRQRIHCVNELYTRATQPVVYVIACNSDSTLKDVTKRYVPNWHSDTRKRRVDEDWWNETMWPYLPPKTAQDREEDEDINRQLQDKPLPAVISEYKDHPLYALKRHLLKFEGIYPADAPTLGFVRGEPVYARECVVTLRSRDMWFKEARVVRLKEEPYKIVKSRPKYDKMTGEFRKDLPLELFGIWQTEDYIPPIAVDGKVPRNEYGNVDLFKPCMLPKGTVHLQIPGLIRVAKKLNIDCAPAVVGFEFHSGGAHPLHDGFVVCEEFKEQVLDAWNKEIDESAKRNEEKREKRIYGNWKRLIRGLLIREKLKLRYAFGENSDEEDSASSQNPGTSQKAETSQKPTISKKCAKKTK